MKNKITKIFCEAILSLNVGLSKTLANLIMALVCNLNSRSVTHLSTGAVYHYKYSSIGKFISKLFEHNDEGAGRRQEMEAELQSLKGAYMPDKCKRPSLRIFHSTSNIPDIRLGSWLSGV